MSDPTVALNASLKYTADLAPTARTLAMLRTLAIGSVLGSELAIPIGFSGPIPLPVPLSENIAGYIVRNDTNQPLQFAYNGNDPDFNLQPGAEVFEINPTGSQPTVPVNQIVLATTQTQSSGDNKIRFFLVERA